ncbi:hypothetical protein [Mammaliicoccus sciuri]|nr:hypothetical protein [Mammaliicoccus sciuri]
MFENMFSALPYLSTICFLIAIYGYNVKIKKLQKEVEVLKSKR